MAQISKKDLVKDIASKLSINEDITKEAIDTLFNAIKGSINKQTDVVINDFGTFSFRVSAPRKGRNLRTGETIDIPATATCRFKISKTFKNNLNYR